MKKRSNTPSPAARGAALPGRPQRLPHAAAVSLEERQHTLLISLNSTARSARSSWLFLISFAAYLFIAIASVTHTDLLLNSPIKLPLLQIDIPLASFFMVSPALFVLIHFGVLLHHAILAQKAESLNRLLGQHETGKPLHLFRSEISSYFFAQSLAGPSRTTIWRLLLRGIGFLTLNFIPIILLLYFQCAYLPAHDPYVTGLHRAYIALDIALMLAVELGRRRNDVGNSIDYVRSPWPIVGGATFSVLLWSLVAFCSVGIATLPG